MKIFLVSIKLTLILIIICAGLFPLTVALVGKLAPGRGKGEIITVKGKVVGYANVGQKFTADKYFWSRPSAVDYNAAGSAGSNKGPTNPRYLETVEDRIDSFLVHNPGIKRGEVPAELVTASGSGLDPDISPASAYVQVKRVAAVRGLSEAKLKSLVDAHVEKPLLGILGPSKVNVLKLNVALEELR
ncbi:K(+)-transporting ATPase subunit C [Longitalea arenae]|uniref:K(+)-transporting ATPase subunit C n=1 Tax=Longitalea arenae TaxID=2812558 RepID=UPI0019673AAC|nr:K(+)-transporting ATPase subunit C [Longitalea arenae]